MGFETTLFGLGIAGTLSPNHPLYVGDSVDKSRHSTGKKMTLRRVNTTAGITHCA
ncbi:hypothetical protein GCM10020218_050400 [Dactylosporangium vinaceum]